MSSTWLSASGSPWRANDVGDLGQQVVPVAVVGLAADPLGRAGGDRRVALVDVRAVPLAGRRDHPEHVEHLHRPVRRLGRGHRDRGAAARRAGLDDQPRDPLGLDRFDRRRERPERGPVQVAQVLPEDLVDDPFRPGRDRCRHGPDLDRVRERPGRRGGGIGGGLARRRAAGALLHLRRVPLPALLPERQGGLPGLAEAGPVDDARVVDVLEDGQRVPARIEHGPFRPGVGEHAVLVVEPVVLDPAERRRREAVPPHAGEVHDQDAGVERGGPVAGSAPEASSQVGGRRLREVASGASPFAGLADVRVARGDRPAAEVGPGEAAHVVEHHRVDVEVDDPVHVVEHQRQEQPVHRRDRDPLRDAARAAVGPVADLVARQVGDRERRERRRQPVRIGGGQPATEHPQAQRAGRVRQHRLDEHRRRERDVLVERQHDVGDGVPVDGVVRPEPAAARSAGRDGRGHVDGGGRVGHRRLVPSLAPPRRARGCGRASRRRRRPPRPPTAPARTCRPPARGCSSRIAVRRASPGCRSVRPAKRTSPGLATLNSTGTPSDVSGRYACSRPVTARSSRRWYSVRRAIGRPDPADERHRPDVLGLVGVQADVPGAAPGRLLRQVDHADRPGVLPGRLAGREHARRRWS